MAAPNKRKKTVPRVAASAICEDWLRADVEYPLFWRVAEGFVVLRVEREVLETETEGWPIFILVEGVKFGKMINFDTVKADEAAVTLIVSICSFVESGFTVAKMGWFGISTVARGRVVSNGPSLSILNMAVGGGKVALL